jgi:cation:H+ antiporter
MIILLGSELFTNGVEWMGKKLHLGEGAVGSLLAAVGTALPETMIPVAAILFSRSAASHEVGIGAIAGAPFMLGTLAFCVTGAAVYVWAHKGQRQPALAVNRRVIGRDMAFFLIGYTVAILATFVREHVLVRYLVAAGLLVLYAYYVKVTLSEETAAAAEIRPLYLKRLLGFTHDHTSSPLVAFQVALALGLILVGSKIFIAEVMHVAERLQTPPLILSLLIAPIATELPEKMNSVLWIRDRKDTLALGNITGAMVFQSCFPVALGVACTPWALEAETLLSAVLALVSTGLLFLVLRLTGRLHPAFLLLGGVFYAFFVVDVVVTLL